MHRSATPARRLVVPALTAVALLLALVAAPAAANAAASPARTDPVDHDGEGTILVTFRRSTPTTEKSSARAAVKGRLVREIKAIRTQAVKVDDVAAALAAYRDRTDVEWAGRDGRVHALDHVPDNRFADGTQWNLQNVSAANPGSMNWHPVYKPDTLGAGIVVAVVDSGVGNQSLPAYDGFK